MPTKFETFPQEQRDTILRIVREMYTFYIKNEIEAIMFGFSDVKPAEFFNRPVSQTFDFESFQTMVEKCVDDYEYFEHYGWPTDEDEDPCVGTVFKEHVLPYNDYEPLMIELFKDENECNVLYELLIG